MAKLPEAYSLSTTPRATRPLAQVSVSGAGAVGEAVAGLGGKVADIGFQIQDQENTAAAKERDAYVSDEIRKILYDPDGGYTNLRGSAAVGARDKAFDQLKQLRDAATSGMTRAAALKLETRLASRIDSAEQTIDSHAGNERRNWLTGAGEARIFAAEQDALAGAVDFSEAFSIVAEEVTQRGLREGWDAAKLDVELLSAKSKMVSAQVVKMASENPEGALELIEKNQASMLPSEYLDLREKIKPLAKEYKGRRLGQQATLTGVSSAYLSSIRSAESGGDDAAKNPLSSATGRYQFTKGTWADLIAENPWLGLTPDGRTYPAQQEVAIRLFTAKNAKVLGASGLEATGGNLYAAHFLGAGDAVRVLKAGADVELSAMLSSAVMEANPFLEGMTVSDFRAWSSRKGGGDAVAYSAGEAPGIDSLLSISDPDIRKAAIAEYNLLTKVAASKEEARIAQATNVAFEYVEAGNDPADLPFDVKTALGMKAMSSLRTYYEKTLDGPVETDPQTYVDLKRMEADDPSRFRSLNIVEYVDRLSPSDFKAFASAQAERPGDVARVAASTLMTVAKRQMEAAGIDTTPKAGSDGASIVAAMQTRLLKWQDGFVQSEGRQPTHAEIDQRIGQELLPVVLNPPGLRFDQEGFVFDAPDIDPEILGRTGLNIGGIEVPPDVVSEQIAQLQASGVEVTSDNLIQRIAELMEGF